MEFQNSTCVILKCYMKWKSTGCKYYHFVWHHTSDLILSGMSSSRYIYECASSSSSSGLLLIVSFSMSHSVVEVEGLIGWSQFFSGYLSVCPLALVSEPFASTFGKQLVMLRLTVDWNQVHGCWMIKVLKKWETLCIRIIGSFQDFMMSYLCFFHLSTSSKGVNFLTHELAIFLVIWRRSMGAKNR